MINREFIAQIVIALATCVGAWMMLVQPRVAEIARLEQSLAETSGTTAVASQEGIEALAADYAEYKRRLEVIQRRNAVAGDTSLLYAQIMRLAADGRVTVHALQPTQPRDVSGKTQTVRATRLEITVTGEYDKVARFLDRVSEIDAFIRPTGLHVIPTDQGDTRMVSVRYTCEVLRFAIDDALATIGGANDGRV